MNMNNEQLNTISQQAETRKDLKRLIKFYSAMDDKDKRDKLLQARTEVPQSIRHQ